MVNCCHGMCFNLFVYMCVHTCQAAFEQNLVYPNMVNLALLILYVALVLQNDKMKQHPSVAKWTTKDMSALKNGHTQYNLRNSLCYSVIIVITGHS